MFKIISKLCSVSLPKWVNILLICLAVAMFGLVCTTGYLDWYYRSVSLSHANGASMQTKEYGPLHPLYLFYVLGCFLSMLFVIIRSVRKHTSGSLKLAGLMLVVVFCNIGMWIVEKFVPLNFEFLSISYLMSEFILFFVHILMQDNIRISDLPAPATEHPQAKPAVIFVDSVERADRVQAILANLPENTTVFSSDGCSGRNPGRQELQGNCRRSTPIGEYRKDAHLVVVQDTWSEQQR